MTVKEYRDKGVEMLLPLYKKEEAKALLGMILDTFCQIPPHSYYTAPDCSIPLDFLPCIQKALDDLCRARPIQYILGKTTFEGCNIHVREGVLIPRPETAELVRWAREVLESPQIILDLCTGSGAIAIALAKAFPQAKVYGVDISEHALEVAYENSLLNKVEISFFKADLLHAPNTYDIPLLPHSFDLVICNPPYICLSEKRYMHPKVLDYEPHLALFVPDDEPLLYYRALACWSTILLKEGGILMAEFNEQMGKEVEKLLISNNFSSIEIRKDINGKPRMVAAVKG